MKQHISKYEEGLAALKKMFVCVCVSGCVSYLYIQANENLGDEIKKLTSSNSTADVDPSITVTNSAVGEVTAVEAANSTQVCLSEKKYFNFNWYK